MTDPRIVSIGTANPPLRLTQEQSFQAAGYKNARIRNIFLNSDIDYRHFYLEGGPNRAETSDQLNERYRRGAVRVGCLATMDCITAARLTVQAVDFLAVCTCTGYVCPDIGSLLVAHMGLRDNVQRASMVGLGCAAGRRYPQVVDFETFLDPAQIGRVGLDHRDGKLRIVLGAEVQHLAGPMIESALARLWHRHGLSNADIRFWVIHPGGRRVIDNVQKYFGMSDDQLRFSRTVLRNYGNMSSPTVMFFCTRSCEMAIRSPATWGR